MSIISSFSVNGFILLVGVSTSEDEELQRFAIPGSGCVMPGMVRITGNINITITLPQDYFNL